jgi:hypothetical protein
MSGPLGSQQWMYNAGGAFYPYSIDQSLRFNDNDSANLSRTPASASNRKTFTFSAWIKLNPTATNYPPIFSAGTSAPDTVIRLDNNGKMSVVLENGGGSNSSLITSAQLRDPSSWYHIVCTIDTTNATADDRIKIYINGTEQTSYSTRTNPSLNLDTNVNNTVLHRLGLQRYGSYWDGYMAEVHFVDGTALDATSFGETINGIWVPKNVSGLTYGTNGFYLSFADSAAIGDDLSGNTNDWTANNLAAHDVVPDSPTLNYSNIVPMPNTSLSEGNLKLTTSRTGYWDGTIGSFGVTSGKWYHEVRMSLTEANFRCVAGWIGNEAAQTVVLNGKGITGDPAASLFDNYAALSWSSQYYKDGTYHGTFAAPPSGSVINIAADFDNGKMWFGIDGTYYANDGGADGDPAAGTNESLSGIDLTASEYVPFFQIRSDSSVGGNVMIANFGQEGTFAGTETDGGYSDENGYGSFFNAVPSGFLALNSANLPEPAIGPNSDTTSDEHFNTVLWTGDGTTNRAITGVGHQPDLLWIKNRGTTNSHQLVDSVRGTSKNLYSDLTNAEDTVNRVMSLDSDGFTVWSQAYVNASGNSYVGWNWKAGGTAVSNTDGSITSSVSANPDAGFAVGTYTGNATAGATIGHSLGATPEMVIVKRRTNARDWAVYHKDQSATPTNAYLLLNSTAAVGVGSTAWNNGTFTSSVFTIGSHELVNFSGDSYVFYAFRGIDGHSKCGKYVGNNSTDGPFSYTGFRPAFVIIKRTDSAAGWVLYDDKRDTYNQMQYVLWPNLNNAEYTSNLLHVDFLSNGFKVRNATYGETNASGGTYIYIAFAEAPFKYANAR